MKIETVAIDSLREDPGNARRHPDKNMRAIKGSLKRFGQRVPLVVRDGTVVAGNGRLRAMLDLGWETVEVVSADDLTEKEARAFGIADNRSSDLAEFDEQALAALLRELDGDVVEDIGWGEKELVSFLASVDRKEAKQDKVPGPPKTPVTKLGDVWELGRHRVVCGSATDDKSVANALCGEPVALMSTDPPYMVDYDATRSGGRGVIGTTRHKEAYKEGGREGWPSLASEFIGLAPLMKGAAVYIWHADVNGPSLVAAMENAGIRIHELIVWCKPSVTMGYAFYDRQAEFCWFGWMGGRPGATGMVRGDHPGPAVWHTPDFERGTGDGLAEKNAHPCIKPIELYIKPIENHTRSGDVCYDPFLGSGTQIVAAEQLDRVCRGIELSPQYVDVIVERWENLTGQKAKRKSQ